MDVPTLAALIRQYGAATDPGELATLVAEIRRRWPQDAEAVRLAVVVEKKARRANGAPTPSRAMPHGR